MKSLILILIATLVLAIPSFAGLGDLDLETQRTLSAIASDTGEAQTLGTTLIVPVQFINGGGAVSWLRTSITTEADETYVSDDLQYRVQGGPQWRGISLQFYVEGDWGKHIDRGTFIRPGTLDIQGWHLSGGVGTYLRGIQSELRREETDPETLLKPLAFVSVSRKLGGGTLATLITWSPTFSFDAHDLLIEPQFTAEVGDVNVTLTGRFGRQHDMGVREYIAQLDYPF